MDHEEKKKRCHNQEVVEPLLIDGEDFSKLHETGHLEYYEDALNKNISLRTILM